MTDTTTVTRKGVTYYGTWREAQTVSADVPGSRVVAYTLGYAVQLRISGPYFSALTGRFA